VTVVAGPAEARERAHPFDGEVALRLRGRHFLDDPVDAVTPNPPVG
jgi:hypothetical protein